MESYRLNNGRSAKRQVLYLGEINDSQEWHVDKREFNHGLRGLNGFYLMKPGQTTRHS